MFSLIYFKSRKKFLSLVFFIIFSLNFSFLDSVGSNHDKGLDKKHILLSGCVGALLLVSAAVIEQLEQQQQGSVGFSGVNSNNCMGRPGGTPQSAPDKDIIEVSCDKNIRFKDVAGLNDKLKEITEIVDFIKHPGKFTNLGAEMPRGVLLEGPPGNGKTLIAKAISNEAGCSFYNVSASTLLLKYVGEGPKAVKKAFDLARSKAPAILFFDEVDAVGTGRGSGNDEERRRTLTQILTEMDGFNSSDNVIVIAATNTADDLDPALLRRFTRKIHIPNPNKESRKDVLNYYINKLPKLEKGIDVNYLADKTEGFSSADLKILKNEAVMLAARASARAVTFNHFKDALEKELERRRNRENKFKDLMNRFNALNSQDEKVD